MNTQAENMFLEYKARFEETERELENSQQECERKRAELEATVSKLAIVQARYDEQQVALETIEAFRTQPVGEAPTGKAKRQSKSRGRPVSENWQVIFSEFPVAPDPVVPITSVYKIVRDLGIEYSENTIRSQLSAFKKKGHLESVDGGWRLLRPLEADGEKKEAEDRHEDEKPKRTKSGVSSDLLNGSSLRQPHNQEDFANALAS